MTVADLRRETKLSQRQFAELFGIPVRTLQQWEQGKSAPPAYVLSMMERLLPRSSWRRGERHAARHIIPPRTSWRVCVDRPFDQCHRVYPTQQRKVRELIDDIARDDAVESIAVFGSSVTERCHRGSDVDVYVEMASDRNPVTEAHDFPFDLWTNYTADGGLKAEIARTGVTVYGKRSDALR